MSTGKILTAESRNIPVLKFVGDVRVLMSSTLDQYCQSLYSKPLLDGMLIDLRETKGIDSTALGLLAKMAIQLRNRFNVVPTVFSSNPDITKTLMSMSFDLIFTIVDPSEESFADKSVDFDKAIDKKIGKNFDELEQKPESEASVRAKVIDAHQTLMALSEDNRLEFQDLVQALKHQP